MSGGQQTPEIGTSERSLDDVTAPGSATPVPPRLHCYGVASALDVDRSRRAARALATTLRFPAESIEGIVLAVSELATNLVRYAHEGSIRLGPVEGPRGWGLQIESRDTGPGIADITLALQDGFSTGGGLGRGLPAVRRLMDDFVIDSLPSGTTIVAQRWLKRIV
jgi:serine/threonine-protein kinase RsbT